MLKKSSGVFKENVCASVAGHEGSHQYEVPLALKLERIAYPRSLQISLSGPSNVVPQWRMSIVGTEVRGELR